MDRDLLREMGGLGFIGLDLPEDVGGMGADAVTTGLVIEELSYGDFNIGAVAVVQSLCGAILQRNADDAIRREWLPRLCRGEVILALAMTEPQAGSDAGAMRLAARRDGANYVLNGEKTSITYSDCADAFVVSRGWKARQIRAAASRPFWCRAMRRGFRPRAFPMWAATCRGADRCSSTGCGFRPCTGSATRAGFSQVMAGFDYSRALIALQCIGAAQASVDEAWAYAQEREAFGGPIARHQGVTFPLAEGRRNWPPDGSCRCTRWRCVMPACLIPSRRQWSNGMGRALPST